MPWVTEAELHGMSLVASHCLAWNLATHMDSV